MDNDEVCLNLVKKKSLDKNCSLFKDMYFIANDPLKLTNVIKACLINLTIIFYYVFWLNIYEYLQYH